VAGGASAWLSRAGKSVLDEASARLDDWFG
jgi:hypothetical protein